MGGDLWGCPTILVYFGGRNPRDVIGLATLHSLGFFEVLLGSFGFLVERGNKVKEN